MSLVAELAGIHLRMGTVAALHGVDLRIARGERLAVVGANGSGKSCLLRVLHGLLAPQQGTVRLEPDVRQAMVFQRPFMWRASARANVAVGLWLGGVPWRQAAARAPSVLAQAGLAEAARQNAAALSVGQQQRLALARAWALRPDMLLLDEPTASLDPSAKREVESVLAGFAQAGATLVLASHNLGQVKRLATRVVYLEGGRLLADLPVGDFFDRAVLPTVSPQADLFLKGEFS